MEHQLTRLFEALRDFLPRPMAVGGSERLRACCGTLLGIFLTGLISRLILGPDAGLPMIK